jgi:predicted nuclease of predicted toxin-antitoxin system
VIAQSLRLRFLLDEGVPDSVGKFLAQLGHDVIHLRDSLAPGSPDTVVCRAAEANDAILVACDGDMKQLVKRYGIGNRRFRKLSLIKLTCAAPRAVDRLRQAISFIEHEWGFAQDKGGRRLFVEIKSQVISTYR